MKERREEEEMEGRDGREKRRWMAGRKGEEEGVCAHLTSSAKARLTLMAEARLTLSAKARLTLGAKEQELAPAWFGARATGVVRRVRQG